MPIRHFDITEVDNMFAYAFVCIFLALAVGSVCPPLTLGLLVGAVVFFKV